MLQLHYDENTLGYSLFKLTAPTQYGDNKL